MTAGANAAATEVVVALAPVANRTSTLTGAALDIGTYDGLLKVNLHGVRTTGSLTPTIEDSADGSTGWATVPTSALSAAFDAVASGTDFLQSRTLDTRQVKQYIRLIGTAASTPDHTYGATVGGQPKYQ